ncbi:MAG: hypothetical protein H6656_06935 [Ardenticatenaceae bacterium]|nr:hypothetical protein [Ardenticatenaceae bacterium]
MENRNHSDLILHHQTATLLWQQSGFMILNNRAFIIPAIPDEQVYHTLIHLQIMRRQLYLFLTYAFQACQSVILLSEITDALLEMVQAEKVEVFCEKIKTRMNRNRMTLWCDPASGN